MTTKLSRSATTALLLSLLAAQTVAAQSFTAEPYNPLDPPGAQERVGAVIQLRTVRGETQFRIDACGGRPLFFVIASSNPDRVDITRLLVAAMTFQKEVKVYNTSGGTDINFCPGADLSDPPPMSPWAPFASRTRIDQTRASTGGALMHYRALTALLTAALLVAFPGGAAAAQGKVLEVQSRDGRLKFKVAGCDQTYYFYFSANDPSKDQAKIIVMASKFSGRPVSVPPACPGSGDVQVTQVDLTTY